VSFEEEIMSKDECPSRFLKSNGDYYVCYPSHIFRYTRDLKIKRKHSDIAQQFS